MKKKDSSFIFYTFCSYLYIIRLLLTIKHFILNIWNCEKIHFKTNIPKAVHPARRISLVYALGCFPGDKT